MDLCSRLPSRMNYCKELTVFDLTVNKFDGSIPKGILNLEKLQWLALGGNDLTGNIPPILTNSSRLQVLDISRNNIKGSIPSDLWRLSDLKQLSFQFNYLTGSIPKTIFNISSLQEIFLGDNFLSGNLPLETSLPCPSLETLYIGYNNLSGPIPPYLSNCSNLVKVDFDSNLFSGPIPKSIGDLKFLEELVLERNQLTGELGYQEQSFLSSLSNCKFLKFVSISSNPLDIKIPDSIENFSDSLHTFLAFQSQIKGCIPMGIGSLKGLT